MLVVPLYKQNVPCWYFSSNHYHQHTLTHTVLSHHNRFLLGISPSENWLCPDRAKYVEMHVLETEHIWAHLARYPNSQHIFYEMWQCPMCSLVLLFTLCISRHIHTHSRCPPRMCQTCSYCCSRHIHAHLHCPPRMCLDSVKYAMIAGQVLCRIQLVHESSWKIAKPMRNRWSMPRKHIESRAQMK
jgi:hypothetical protein